MILPSLERLPAPALPPWIEAALPAGLQRFAVSVGDYRMHVMLREGSGPTVLLLHGNPTWGFLWRRVAAALDETPLRLVMPDLVPDSLAHPSVEPLRKCQAYFEAFEGPVAVVWGDRDPILGRVRSWIERLKPSARVTRTPAGHFLQEEVPNEIAAAILQVATISGSL